MKTDLFYVALRQLFVLSLGVLMIACGRNNPDIPTPVETNTNPSYVFPAVVSPDYNKANVAVCDTAKGQYAIQFKDEVPVIKAGSVVIVQDGEAHRIVLVTKATTEGKRVDFSGKLGDLRYVFKNTKFTLRIGEADGSSEGGSVYYPTKSYDDASTRAEKSITLWDEPYEKDFTLWELQPEDYPEWMIQIPTSTEEHADLSAHVLFDPMLVADLVFEFGAETQDFLDDIAFSLAGAYDVTATITGDFHSSLDFTFNYKMDDVWDGIVHGGVKPRYFFDKTELLKHDLFHKDFVFFVGIVPVDIHAGCDLFTEMMMSMHGEAKLTFGVESDMHVMASAKVSPYRDQVLDYDKDFDFDWDGHEPVFSGQESVDLKWYLYPHFYFWVDYGAGPCLDIKPYARVDGGHGGQKNFTEWQSYDDFYTWTTKGYVGLDWAVGLSTPLENYFYEADAVTKDLGNIKEWEFLKSPSGLILDSQSGEIKAGKPTTFDFRVLGDFYGKPATTWFPTFIKLDFPKNGTIETLFPILGKASYTWTPQYEDDEMVARVFDLDGTVLGQLNFRAGAGDAIKVITGDASNITAESVTIVSIVESSIPVLNTGIVYSSSAELPVIGGADSISKLSSETSSSFSVTLSGLKPNTQYNYRAYAVIDGGESSEYIVYGTVKSFTTDSDVPTTFTVTPTSIDFERVDYGTDKTATFMVTNTGNGILRFRIACECHDNVFEVRGGEEQTLAKGASKEFTVIAHGMKRNSSASCDIRVIPTSGDGTKTVSVRAEGWDNEPLTLETTSITMKLGDKEEVNIIFGSLDYEISNENPSVVNAKISTQGDGGGGRYDYWSYTYKYVNLEALTVGTSTIKVTDKERNEKVTLIVTVTENGITYAIPEAVDLGLPSGLKWASFNLGATKPEEYGAYFAWGETEPKNSYTWETYKWCMGTYNTLTKYCMKPDFGYEGFTDGKTVLDLEDDAAHVKLGGKWRMPTYNEEDELLSNCTWEWIAIDGVWGQKLTGPNGKSVFFPAAGYKGYSYDYYEDYLFDSGSRGAYWTASHCKGEVPNVQISAEHIWIDSKSVTRGFKDCKYGLTIRPVYGDSASSNYILYDPSPKDGATGVDPHVYFSCSGHLYDQGENNFEVRVSEKSDMSNPLQRVVRYCGPYLYGVDFELESNKTYYWQVKEFDFEKEAWVIVSPIWHFTTK